MRIDDTNWDSITAAQSYITRWANNTFPRRTPTQALSKLVLHEVPELLIELKKGRDPRELEKEFADTLILLFDLASLWRIDIPRGLKEKMRVNEHRMWAIDGDGIAQHVSAQHPPITEQGAGR